MNESPVRVMFVCLGNICRSPTAHGVFRRMVEDAGLTDRIEIASSGPAIGISANRRTGVPRARRLHAISISTTFARSR